MHTNLTRDGMIDVIYSHISKLDLHTRTGTRVIAGNIVDELFPRQRKTYELPVHGNSLVVEYHPDDEDGDLWYVWGAIRRFGPVTYENLAQLIAHYEIPDDIVGDVVQGCLSLAENDGYADEICNNGNCDEWDDLPF